MTNLVIKQNSNIEIVNNSIIQKLYELTSNANISNAELEGNLQSDHATMSAYNWLTGNDTQGNRRFPNLALNITNGLYIEFADPVVEQLCATNFGDGVGTTLTQAQSVNTINDLFRDNTNITSFDEFRYFTSVTSLNTKAFQGCSNLSSIEFPSSIQNLGQHVFRYATSLSGIIDLSNTKLTQARAGLFESTKITGIIFPMTLVTYGEYMSSPPLSNVTTCTIFKGLDNVISINNSDVINCTNAVYLGKYTTGNISPIAGGQQRSASVNQIYFPVFANYTGNDFGAYYGTPGLTFFTYRCQTSRSFSANLVYFKDLQTIIGLFFYGTIIKNLVINNTTPPVFDTTTATYSSQISSTYINQVFGQLNSTGANGMIIYVPDSAVSTYQADTNYNSYVIRGINEINPSTNQPYLTRYATNELWEAAGSPADALIEEYMQ